MSQLPGGDWTDQAMAGFLQEISHSYLRASTGFRLAAFQLWIDTGMADRRRVRICASNTHFRNSLLCMLTRSCPRHH